MLRLTILTIATLALLSTGAFESQASGKKKKKADVHDHLHIEDIEASDNPREFIQGKTDVDGYLTIGWWYKNKDLKEAFSIINEGIKHNPKAFQLHYQLGQLYLERAKSETKNIQVPNEESLETLKLAQQSYKTAAELGIKQRSKAKVADWGNVKELDVRGAARMTVLMERRYGDHLEADRLSHEYADKLGGDEKLDRHKHAH